MTNLERMIDPYVRETTQIDNFLFYHDVISLMKEFAKLMCEEQRKICTRKARTKKENGNYYDEKVVDEDSILNSPLPPELR